MDSRPGEFSLYPYPYYLDISTENKGLNAKGWDMAHVTLEMNVGDGV